MCDPRVTHQRDLQSSPPPSPLSPPSSETSHQPASVYTASITTSGSCNQTFFLYSLRFDIRACHSHLHYHCRQVQLSLKLALFSNLLSRCIDI